MLNLGCRQKLKIARKVRFGVYLSDGGYNSEKKMNRTVEVLLPMKEVPETAEIGTELDVFLYKDSEGRMIATLRDPLIHLHEVRRLRVKDLNNTGAFMETGLERDVLLPYAEQTRRVEVGESILCAMYLDKSERLCVTMNVYPYLKLRSPYLKDMQVEGTIYEKSDNFGLFVAVDDMYSALIPKKEVFEDIRIGDIVKARVSNVHPDGKMDLSLRKKAFRQMEDDAVIIEERMKLSSGILVDDRGNKITEKSESSVITQNLHMSKAAFKRALGRLLKEERISIDSDGSIRLI